MQSCAAHTCSHGLRIHAVMCCAYMQPCAAHTCSHVLRIHAAMCCAYVRLCAAHTCSHVLRIHQQTSYIAAHPPPRIRQCTVKITGSPTAPSTLTCAAHPPPPAPACATALQTAAHVFPQQSPHALPQY